jgi:outer membrane usher protein
MLRLLLQSIIKRSFLIAALALVSFVLPAKHAKAAQGIALQLEVILNDVPTNLVASFIQLPDNRIGACAAELIEIGIKISGASSDNHPILLDDIPGVAYRYDEPGQKIFVRAGDKGLVTRVYNVYGRPKVIAPVPTDFGAVFNYTLFASSTAFPKSMLTFSGASASIDARAFGPYGTLSQSAILGSNLGTANAALRLDTTWAYSDPQNMNTYRAGDVISGGLAWTRPIRLGGVQMQRNFSLRPDLVTMPLPSVSGSAAVPSIMDVYVNNVKVQTQDLTPGPYQITNIPMLTGAGDARVVLRDSAGRTTEVNIPFYASLELLRPGMTDFSAEAGVPRVGFGTSSDSYVENPIGSASLRAGIYDWLTAESHFESGIGLANGGGGGVIGIGALGVASFAASASHFERETGFQSYVAFDGQISGLNLHLSSQHTFGHYNDLASLSARCFQFITPAVPVPNPYLLTTATIRPPRFIDTISIGTSLFDSSSLSVAFLHVDLNQTKPSDIVNVSYSRPVIAGGSVYLTAYKDFNDRNSFGFFAGLTVPLGDKASATSGVSRTPVGTGYTIDAAKPLDAEPGSYGWRLRADQGATYSGGYYGGGASYRSSVARIDVDALRTRGGTSGAVQAEGSVAALDDGIFLTNRINDAFAVVDVGAPNVDVSYENRPVGKTDAQGKILLTELRSYQTNKIAIDPQGLPLNAEAPVVQEVVAPADRSGLVVRFGVKTEVGAAVLILARRDGGFVPPGTSAKLGGSKESFVVGYDGRAYMTGLGPTNTVVVDDPAGQCRSSFSFTPKKDGQVVIGPLTCQ